MGYDPIVNRTMAALRSKGLATSENTNSDVPKLVYQIPIGEQVAPGFTPSKLQAYMNAETQTAYVYYGDEVVGSFNLTDPNAAYDPFKWVTARGVIEMSILDKIPTLATSSTGEVVEYRALTNNLQVDANGFITATAAGIGCIECSITYNGERCVSLCLVKVSTPSEFEVESQRTNEPTDIFFINYPKNLTMRVGDYNPVTAYVWPNHILEDDNLAKIISSNPDVLQCDYGILHAVKPGQATLTAMVYGHEEITASIDITIEEAFEATNIYEVTSLPVTTTNGVLHNDGTEPLATAKAISDLIQKAMDEGYDGIKFPPGTYSVTLDDTLTYNSRPAIITISQKNLDIDFQGATIAEQINARTYVNDGEGAYHSSGGQSLIRFDGAENVILRNAIVKGTKGLEHDTTKQKSWYDMLIDATNCVDCKCVNVEVCESNSWGVAITGGMYPTISIWADEFKVGGYTDSGVYDETLTGFCTVVKSTTSSRPSYSVPDYNTRYNVGSDIWANGDYPFCSSRMYNILWFDTDQKLIEIHKNRHQHYTYYDRPLNAAYFAVHFINPLTTSLPTGGGAQGIHEDGKRSYVCALGCHDKADGFTMEDCYIHDNGTMGGANTNGWNCRLIRCSFSNNGGWDNDWDWDVEDGGANSNIMIIDCHFQGFGLVTAMPCTDMVVLNNRFNGGYTSFNAPLNYPRIISNFFNGMNPSLQCQTSGVFADNTFANRTVRTKLTSGRLGGHENAVYGYIGNNNYNLTINEEKTITGISATYSGGSVPAGTALDDLTGIVVTAQYSDGSTATVTGYTLSGEIAEGSNTITVTYQGKTATFTVTGTAVAGIALAYSLPEPLTFAGTGNAQYDTGYAMYPDGDKDVSICIDFSAENGPNSNVGIILSSVTYGYRLWHNGARYFRVSACQGDAVTDIVVPFKNVRLVWKKEKGNAWHYAYALKDDSVTQYIGKGYNYFPTASTATTKIGTTVTSFKGVIHDFRVYDQILSDEQIETYLRGGSI